MDGCPHTEGRKVCDHCKLASEHEELRRQNKRLINVVMQRAKLDNGWSEREVLRELGIKYDD